MDFKEWQVPVLGALGTAVAALFGLQTYRRKQSKDDLADAENTVGGLYVNRILAELEKMTRERDEAMQKAQVNYELYRAEQKRADQHELGIQRLNDQVDRLTKSVLKYRPGEKNALTVSGFGELDTPKDNP